MQVFFLFVRKKCFVDAMGFPALRARAHLSGPDGPVDFPALRARAHMSAPAVLWITRAGLAVDYGPGGPVDYACWHMLWITRLTPLWISGGVGAGFIVAPSHCGGGE